MLPRQTFRTMSRLWLLTDARTDAPPDALSHAGLDAALRALPRGAGVVFRHYHLAPDERARRFARLARLCRQRGLCAVWAGAPAKARRYGAQGCYGAAQQVAGGPAMLRLVTAHSLRELAAARRARADAVLLSPVFATRSHPGAATLGAVRWLLLARRSPVPAIALGGMNRRTARRLPGHGWAAIDGLATARKRHGNPKDS